MTGKNRNNLGVSNNAEITPQGIPNILSLRNEPLNSAFTLKLWPSVHQYIEKHGGAEFIREAILQKLQRIMDQPSPAVCAECINLNLETYEDPFCLVLTAFLQRKHLKEKWSCDYFQPRKEKRK